MEFDVIPYKQRGNTCAIACMLMVLEYYKIIPKADWIYERKYYKTYKSRYIEGTPFSALAWYLSKNGLDIEIIHSDKNVFNNEKEVLSKQTFTNTMNEYLQYLNDASRMGTKINNGISLTSELLKEKVLNKNMIILAGVTNSFLHAILICGYKNNKFIVCDPLHKNKQEKSDEEINIFMNTPLGKWCIVVREK